MRSHRRNYNYRPISLISCFSKIFEKILVLHITKFLNLNNSLSNSQFGFNPNKSITDHMLHFFSTFNSSLSQNLSIHTVYLNLFKPFDTVSHPKLIYKLNKSVFIIILFVGYKIIYPIENFMFVLIM